MPIGLYRPYAVWCYVVISLKFQRKAYMSNARLSGRVHVVLAGCGQSQGHSLVYGILGILALPQSFWRADGIPWAAKQRGTNGLTKT